MTNNSSLTSLDQLGNLMFVQGNVRIEELSALEELSFPNLHVVDGSFRVLNLDQIVSISQMPYFTEVDGNLDIMNNVQLSAIAGLSALSTITGNLNIIDNPKLSTDLAVELAERAMLYPQLATISGNAE